MHFPDCGRHLRDRVDILDHETMRQKSLIDQLHDPFICRVKPDRPEMLSAYLHVSVYIDVTLTNNLNATLPNNQSGCQQRGFASPRRVWVAAATGRSE
jgi:hypothetical protein